MDLFEYQGKQYFARYDIPVSPGGVADTVDEAVVQAEKAGYPVVVKAQVQVGGRGKAGGIQLANNADEVRKHATNILGMDIKGHVVKRLWVEHASDIAKEYYASFTLDRSAKQFLGMLSAKGGIEIESNPESIVTLYVNPAEDLDPGAVRKWVDSAGMKQDEANTIDLGDAAKAEVVDTLLKLYRCFVEGDADLVEINPLILTPDGHIHALDSKVSLDDSAAYRHPEWDAFRGLQVMDEREKLAKEKGLQYIGLDGDVGIIANGAGLAMSTLDTVTQVGGSAANFLDIGGGANADVVTNALTVINTDPKVKVILINIFGGVTRCDEVAKGIIEATKRVQLKSPIVVRLDGTNVDLAREILDANKSDTLIRAADMLDAARKAVQLAGGK
ncbi:MAG: ADP-forming succinate--CoA ligase subunit beta [Chloroflexota bacterium]